MAAVCGLTNGRQRIYTERGEMDGYGSVYIYISPKFTKKRYPKLIWTQFGSQQMKSFAELRWGEEREEFLLASENKTQMKNGKKAKILQCARVGERRKE